MHSLFDARRGHEAIVVIGLVFLTLLCSIVVSQASRQAVLSMDASYLVFPRAGFHELERFTDQPRVFRWTRGRSWLGLPNPGGSVLLRLAMIGGPTPVRMRVGASEFNLTVQPELRYYTLLLHETERERLSLTIESPVVAVRERNLGIMVSDIEVIGSTTTPHVLMLALTFAAVGGYVLLRQVGWPTLPAAGVVLFLQLIVLFWHHLSGWRYGLTGPILLLLGGTALASGVLERSWGHAARARSVHTMLSPLTLRTIGVLLALMCVFLPWLSVAETFPEWLTLSLATATVGVYLQLKHVGWGMQHSVGGILLLELVALIWYASNLRGADLVGPALLILGATSLAGSVLKRDHFDLLVRNKATIASILFVSITIAAIRHYHDLFIERWPRIQTESKVV